MGQSLYFVIEHAAIIVFDLRNCSSIELNTDSGELPGKRILSQCWLALLPCLGYTPPNDVFGGMPFDHARRIQLVLVRKCSRIEH